MEIILGKWSAELARHCKGSLVPEGLTITVVENVNFHSEGMQFSDNIVYPENHSKWHIL